MMPVHGCYWPATADGSMRDALSLADRAIARGRKVTTEVVTQMLGTLDDEQPLTIPEAPGERGWRSGDERRE